jgi:flagellin
MTRINTNIPSLQAGHILGRNQEDLKLRLERLSTGLRINRGRDDPAGLIASEVLRSEIRGISQAIENSQRAVNVISTAEGSLNEIASLLLDVRGLVQGSANDGALSDTEIEANQLEIDSILESIDRIANSTQFGGDKLIDGTLAYTLSGVNSANIADQTVLAARIPEGGQKNVVVQVTNSAETGYLRFAASGLASSNPVTIEVKGSKGAETLSFAGSAANSAIAFAINQSKDLTGVSASLSTNNSGLILSSTQYGSDQFVTVSQVSGTFQLVDRANNITGTDKGADATVLVNGVTATTKGLDVTSRSGTLSVDLTLTAAFGQTTTVAGGANTELFAIKSGGATFQIGPEVDGPGQVSIGIPSVSTAHLGNTTIGLLSTLRSGAGNELSRKKFATANDVVKKAISQIAVLRGRLGGLQKNQLETNIRSQQVALENVSASESAIRDADYATEVSALTRAQILVQSGTSILGLANQLPQNALSLLG